MKIPPPQSTPPILDQGTLERVALPALPSIALPAACLLLTACHGLGQSDDSGLDYSDCPDSILPCSRPVDQVAFPTTHNAMSNEDDGWLFPNQQHDIPTQLADGVRAMMLDLHYDDEVVNLCHSECWLGSQTLHEGLREITDFLDEHPTELLAIIFESYVSATDAVQVFRSLGLDQRAWSPEPHVDWPTVEEMTDAGFQLLVFSDFEGGDPAWYMDLWSHAWETPWDNQEPGDFTCDPTSRGSTENPFSILNHFLTDPVALPELAEQVNFNPFFVERAQDCQQRWDRVPNFVTVDFYDIGDLFTVTDTLNAADTNRQ